MTVTQAADTSEQLYPTRERLELAFNAVRRAKVPQIPDVVLALREELARSEPRLDVAAQLIAQDLALTGQLLKMINSPLFACPTKIASVPQAVRMVGLNRLTNMAAAEAIARILEGREGTARLIWESIMSEARAMLAVAALIDTVSNDEAYLYGIMHDVGCLIFAELVPDYATEWVVNARSGAVHLLGVEQRSLGVDHALVGFLLAGTWRLPQPIALAICHHHADRCPDAIDPKARALILMSVLAHALVDLLEGEEEQADRVVQREGVLAELGISESEWAGLAQSFIAGQIPSL